MWADCRPDFSERDSCMSGNKTVVDPELHLFIFLCQGTIRNSIKII